MMGTMSRRSMTGGSASKMRKSISKFSDFEWPRGNNKKDLDTHWEVEATDASFKDAVIFYPKRQHLYTVIFLHGWGHPEMEPFVESILKTKGKILSHTKIVMALADELPKGYEEGNARQWARVTAIADADAPEDETYFRISQVRVQHLIWKEISSGIRPEKIAVGGFSQGGATAYLAGLEFPARLGAVFAISSWIPLLAEPQRAKSGWPSIPFKLSKAAHQTPILHLHGKDDMLILPEWATWSKEYLRARGLDVQEMMFDLGHQTSEEEAVLAADFLEANLGRKNNVVSRL